VPLTASLAFSAATDTGISQTDGITKNNQPMVQGTGPAGSVLRMYGQAVRVICEVRLRGLWNTLIGWCRQLGRSMM
jgi:hypothetical protein